MGTAPALDMWPLPQGCSCPRQGPPHPPRLGTGTCLRMFCSRISFCRSRLGLVTMMSSTFCPLLGTSLTKNTRSSSSWMTNLHEGTPGKTSVRHRPWETPLGPSRHMPFMGNQPCPKHTLIQSPARPAGQSTELIIGLQLLSPASQLSKWLSIHTPRPHPPWIPKCSQDKEPQYTPVWKGTVDTRQCVWREGGLNPPLTSCVTMKKSLNLSEPRPTIMYWEYMSSEARARAHQSPLKRVPTSVSPTPATPAWLLLCDSFVHEKQALPRRTRPLRSPG